MRSIQLAERRQTLAKQNEQFHLPTLHDLNQANQQIEIERFPKEQEQEIK
jgi:hypothetical protein